MTGLILIILNVIAAGFALAKSVVDYMAKKYDTQKQKIEGKIKK